MGIIDFFNRIRGRSTSGARWKMLTLTPDQLAEHPNGLEDIYQRKIDGFLLQNVFSAAEMATLRAGFDRMRGQLKVTANPGIATFPRDFASVSMALRDSPASMAAEVAKWQEFEANSAQNFGIDWLGRIIAILTGMAGGKAVGPPTEMGQIARLSPGNFRELRPGKGEFNTHCGNRFLREFPDVYRELQRVSQVENQLSFFLVVQNSEAGGELTLFDVDWDQASVQLPGGIRLEDKAGKVLELEGPRKVAQTDLRPEAGDMVIFAGGQIWHKVKMAEGSRTRITLGGFLTRSLDGKMIHTWA